MVSADLHGLLDYVRGLDDQHNPYLEQIERRLTRIVHESPQPTPVERQTAALETIALAVTALAMPQVYPPGTIPQGVFPVAGRLESLLGIVRGYRKDRDMTKLEPVAADNYSAIAAALVDILAMLGRDVA